MSAWDWFVAYWLFVLTIQAGINAAAIREKNRDR